jgi:hypothetical protein
MTIGWQEGWKKGHHPSYGTLRGLIPMTRSTTCLIMMARSISSIYPSHRQLPRLQCFSGERAGRFLCFYPHPSKRRYHFVVKTMGRKVPVHGNYSSLRMWKHSGCGVKTPKQFTRLVPHARMLMLASPTQPTHPPPITPHSEYSAARQRGASGTSCYSRCR